MVERKINGILTSTKTFKDIYPFKSRFTNINGHIMHYIDEGSGQPILMLHGNPTWSFYFRKLISDLSKNFRVIAPDHIGCGFSDKPDEKHYNYTLKSRVRDIDTLITQLDIKEKINLIVHDWGGMIGLAWVLDSLNSQVNQDQPLNQTNKTARLNQIDKIIISNTSGFLLPEDKNFPFLLGLIKYCKLFAVPAVLGLNAFAKGALFLACKKKMSRKARQGMTEPYNSWENRISNLKFVQDIPISPEDESYAIVKHVDRHLELLDENKLMFIWGAKDFVFDLKFLNEFKRRFPNALSHIFRDAGHYLFEDKAEESLKLIKQFLPSPSGEFF